MVQEEAFEIIGMVVRVTINGRFFERMPLTQSFGVSDTWSDYDLRTMVAKEQSSHCHGRSVTKSVKPDGSDNRRNRSSVSQDHHDVDATCYVKEGADKLAL